MPSRGAPSSAHEPTGTPPAPEERAFSSELWLWDARRNDTWTFVTLPADLTAALQDEADSRGPRAGFGSVKVIARIASTTWRTSVFPDSATGCFVLPVKRSVRQATGIEAGDTIAVSVRLAP